MENKAKTLSLLDAWQRFKNGYTPNIPPNSYKFSIHENIEVYYRCDMSEISMKKGFFKLKAIVRSSHHELKANYHLSVRLNKELTIQNDKESRNLKINYPEDFSELQKNMEFYITRLDEAIKAGEIPSPGESESRAVKIAKVKVLKCRTDNKKKAVGGMVTNIFNPDDKD